MILGVWVLFKMGVQRDLQLGDGIQGGAQRAEHCLGGRGHRRLQDGWLTQGLTCGESVTHPRGLTAWHAASNASHQLPQLVFRQGRRGTGHGCDGQDGDRGAGTQIGQSHEHRQVIERCAAWHVQRRLRRFAERGPITGKQTQQARAEIGHTVTFLAWLVSQGRDPGSCTQADIDVWYADAYSTRRLTNAFLRWSVRNRTLPR